MRLTRHTLNLIVRDDLTDVYDSITPIPNVVKYVKSSLKYFNLVLRVNGLLANV